MKKLYMSALFLCTALGVSAQEVIWQKDIKSSTQDFLSQVTTSIDNQYLITGSSIHPSTGSGTTPSRASGAVQQNRGYDYHLVKLNSGGEEIWEKYFSGKNHDFLSATVNTQEGGYLLAGTSYSGKGLDKKEESHGGSDFGWCVSLKTGMKSGRKRSGVRRMKRQER